MSKKHGKYPWPRAMATSGSTLLILNWRQVEGSHLYLLTNYNISPPDNPLATEPLIDVTSFLKAVPPCWMEHSAHDTRVIVRVA